MLIARDAFCPPADLDYDLKYNCFRGVMELGTFDRCQRQLVAMSSKWLREMFRRRDPSAFMTKI